MTKPNVIEMHDITKKFGEFVANDHINLDVRQGEIHALLGENGAGKSTLFNAITGNIVPTMGTIAFNNTVINKKRPAVGKWNKLIGRRLIRHIITWICSG